MPRTVAVFALILMLLTGLALGQMRSLRGAPVQIAATADKGAAQTARAFYAAVNLFLESGDAESISPFLAPGFIGHSSHAAVDESAGDFMKYLGSLRSTFPGLQLEVSDLSAQAGTVAMDVTLTGNTAGSFGGLPLDAGSGASGYEVLRVEGQQIAERWGSREMPPLYQSMTAVDMPVPANTYPEPRIERLAFEPNGSLEFIDYDGFILVAESGAVTWQVVSYTEAAADPAPATLVLDSNVSLPAEGASFELAPGESIATPAGVRFRIVNRGSGAASMLMIAIRQAQFATEGSLSYKVIASIDMERILLAGGGVAPVVYEGSTRSIAVGKVVLPPGAEIPRHLVVDAEMLVVTAGEIDVTVHHGTMVWNQPGKRFVTVAHEQTMAAGQGARANPGAVVEYRAGSEEPAALWLVTIQGYEPGVSSEG